MKRKRMRFRISVMTMMALMSSQVLSFAATAPSDPPTRSQVSDKYKWNLKELYANRAAFEADLTKVEKELIPKAAAYKGKLNDPVQFKAYMKLDEEMSRLISKAYTYAYFSSDLNQTDNVATEMLDSSIRVYTLYEKETAFVAPEFSNMDVAKFENLYKDESLATYKRFFDKIKINKDHTLSHPEEQILSGLGDVLNSPNSIFSKITLADYKSPVIKDSKGKEIEVTDAKYSQIMKSNDRALRKKAYEASMASYESQINALAANYATQVKIDVFNAKTRGYASSLEAALANEEIPKSIYDNLIASVNKNLNYLHKYQTAKKNYFGFDKMYSYDTNLPISASLDTNYSYDEAVAIIEKSLAPLGKQYVADFKKGIANRWVDAYPDTNKYTGGYQGGTYDTHPYILMNYSNSLDDALTLAHEFGHALNTEYSNKSQDYRNSDYPIFTAEVASTTNEMLVMDYLIKNSKNKDEKLFLINKQIDNIRNTVYAQVMFAEFEQKIHEIAEQDKPLSPEVLNRTWLDLVKKYNGKDLTVLDQSQYYWSRISHFYTPFYVYKYATSMPASYSIVNQMNGKDSEKAIENYLAFLSAGGSKTPIDALKLAGVDMNSPESVDSILKYFGSLVDEYDKLLKEKKAAQKKAS